MSTGVVLVIGFLVAFANAAPQRLEPEPLEKPDQWPVTVTIPGLCNRDGQASEASLEKDAFFEAHDKLDDGVRQNRPTKVRMGLCEGANPNDLDFENATHPALFKAATIEKEDDNSIEIVKLLLEAGADPNFASGHTETTALHHLCRRNRVKSAKAVIEAGADVNKANWKGNAALWITLADNMQPELELVKYLLSHGLDVNAMGSDKWPPLCKAAEKGFEEITRLLIEHGADVDAVNKWGRTPLSLAANNRKKVTMEILLEAGADPMIEDKKGKHAIDYDHMGVIKKSRGELRNM